MSQEHKFEIKFPSGYKLIASVLTCIVGYNIHHSLFWTICDWIFWPLAWIKWIIFQEINLTIIKNAFSFFFT